MSIVTPRVLKGFRDYLPEVELPRQAMLSTITKVFEGFGFGPLTTPALEYSEILLGKYGEEGDKLLYRFEDNGHRDVALRYDLTVPLARVIGQHGHLPQPFRRYQVAPVWRAEKPARGRFREFMQCDVDVVGEPSMRADAECMIVGLEVLAALEVPLAVMRVNNRRILDGLLEVAGVSGREATFAALRAIDKLPKIGRAKVEGELRQAVGLDDAQLATLFEGLETEVAAPSDLEALRSLVGETEQGAKGLDELAELLSIVEGAGYLDRVEVDLSIARGLDYYTATIYETFLVGHEAYGSVMSGGRYDGLMGMFMKQSVPAVGISLGVDRLISALVDLDAVIPRKTAADVYVLLFAAEDYGPNLKLARTLRAAGLGSELALKPARIGKQFRLAQRKGYRYVALHGESERADGVVVIKDLDSGEQQRLAIAQASEWAPRFAL